jgi:hypothetical protein
MLVCGGAQFVIGGVLEPEQGVVGAGRVRRATAAPCLPSAVRVFAGRCAIVFLPAADR